MVMSMQGFMLVSTFINQTSQTRECSPYNTSCTKLEPPPGSNWGWNSESSTGQLYVAHAEDLQVSVREQRIVQGGMTNGLCCLV